MEERAGGDDAREKLREGTGSEVGLLKEMCLLTLGAKTFGEKIS